MIRLSFSALEELLTCERKFQLNRLLLRDRESSVNANFAFGHAFEAGCVSYILNRDEDRAIWDTFMAYQCEGEIPYSTKKTALTAVNTVKAAFSRLDNLLEDWEVAIFQEKPACQLSFRINIDETFYYVGYIDLVLHNRFTNMYAVWDAKTTGLNLLDLAPLYQNSAQLIGYSIVLDSIVGEDYTEYAVQYFVGQIGATDGFKPTIVPLIFEKTLKDRLNFFIMLGMDIERLKLMQQVNIYPQRGGACLRFNKPCFHFTTCGLHALDIPAKEEPDEIEYQFVFNLEDIVKNHMKRIT